MITREKILEHMRSRRYRPAQMRGMSRFFDIAEEDYPRFRSIVNEMVREGEIIPGRRGRLRLPRRVEGRKGVAAEKPKGRARGEVVGTFRLSERGFGFVVPAEGESDSGGEDIFVPKGQNGDAITGDTVRVALGRKGRLGPRGRIMEVIERGQRRFVGTYYDREGRRFIRPDGTVLFGELLVGDVTSRGPRLHDKVVFEVLRYPRAHAEGEAVIVEVLGKRGEPGVDTLSVIKQFELPEEFPDEALAEARDLAREYEDEDFSDRVDLSDTLTVTIDPADARDFDDAISLRSNGDGTMTLGVHIADVAHFVRVGSHLDAEARERGTSVYLPTMVIPMLPELLSNGLCSLQQGKARLTKSVFITLDEQAEVRKVECLNSIINNTRRLTYEEASGVLDGGGADGIGADVVDLLKAMDDLARRILARRREAGYLELEMPAVDLDFDEDGRVVAAYPEDTSFSHKIIEMFMVEANEAVARHLEGRGIHFIRRIHPEPDAESAVSVKRFARSCGYRLRDSSDRRQIQDLLAKVQGRPESYAMNLAILKSFQQAQYSVRSEGHYALASDAYCHFTSPIRRYPDLTVHRLLDGVIRSGAKRRRKGAGKAPKELVALALHCTETEQRAEDAERELTKIKVLELLEKHLGETFEGIITGVQGFGLFVESPTYLIDGLVHMSDLTDDDYRLDKRSWSLVGQHTGRVLRIGSPFKVRISEVDIPRRKLFLEPVEEGAKRGRKERRRKR
ncbi:MAG: ribonuclease R [Planctomycetia bacterium]|nr:ribonuclease R [Planctomycetia bacterium]